MFIFRTNSENFQPRDMGLSYGKVKSDKLNLITNSLKDKDIKLAAKITYLLSNKFTKFVNETNKKKAECSARII